MKTEPILKAEAPSLDLLTMAAHAQLMKAQFVEGYEREDGTRVKAHERDTGQPKTSKYALAAARHELAANRYAPSHPRYALHTELSALHFAADHHANRVNDAKTDADRKSSTRALAYLENLIASKERALDGKTQDGEPMRKAVPVLIKSVRSTAQPAAGALRYPKLAAEMDFMAARDRALAAGVSWVA